MLKAGKGKTDSNFEKIREEAIKVLQDKFSNQDLTLEDLISNNSDTDFNLPFETEVDKTFIGTPNISLNEDGSAKINKIDPKFVGKDAIIIDFGYSENGKLSKVSLRKMGLLRELNYRV